MTERGPEAGPRIALAGAALVLAAAPTTLAAFLGATGSTALAAILPLESAFEAALVASACVIALVWPLLALGERARALGFRARAVELALVLAGLAPGLRAASIVSRVQEEAAASAWAALYALAGAYGVALVGLGASRLRRSTIVTLLSAVALGAPIACAYAGAVLEGAEPLAQASALSAVLDLAQGTNGFPWALAVALVLVGLTLLVARRARDRRAAVALVALALALGLDRAIAEEPPERDLALVGAETKTLLGDFHRSNELAPLRVVVKAGKHGFQGELGARSGGLVVLVPLSLPSGTAEVVLPAVGGTGSTILEARPRGGAPFALELEGSVKVSENLRLALVTWIKGSAKELTRALSAGHAKFTQREVDARSLDLAANAGGALDVFVVKEGVGRAEDERRRLAAFAAAGGAVVFDDERAPDGFASLGAGPASEENGVIVRGLGAGLVVARREKTPASAVAVAARLGSRLEGWSRAPVTGFANAPLVAGPSASAERRLAIRSALVTAALFLVLVALARAEARRLVPGFFLASVGCVLLVPSLVFGGARSPVILEASEVLEAPSGGRVAGSLEVLRFTSPRRCTAEVELLEAAPVAAFFTDARDAARSRAELRLPSASATLEPAPANLTLECGSSPAVFFRRTSRLLPGEGGGSVELARSGAQVTVRNRTSARIASPFLLLGNDRVVDGLPDIAPGGELAVPHASSVPFRDAYLRLRAKGEKERRRVEILNWVLRGPGDHSARLVGFLDEAAREARSGVLEEVTGPVILLVREQP